MLAPAPVQAEALSPLRRLVFDLSPVLAGGLPILLEGGIPFELLREEVEVLAPREVRVVQEGVFPGDQIELVIRQRQIEVGIVQRLVVVRRREEAGVLLRDLKILYRSGEGLRGGLPVFFYEAVPSLVIRVPEIGEGHGELFVDELLVLGQGKDALELADRSLVIVLLVQIDAREPVVRLGVIRMLLVGAGVGLDRSEEHTSELQSLAYLVCRLLLEKKKKSKYTDLS